MNTKTLISAIILTVLILSVPASAATMSSARGSGGSGAHNELVDFIRNSMNAMSIAIPCQSGYVYCYEQNYIYGNAQAMARIYVSDPYIEFPNAYINFLGDGTKFYRYRGITSWSQVICDKNGCNGELIGSSEKLLLGSEPQTSFTGVAYVVWDTNTYNDATAWTWVGTGFLGNIGLSWSPDAYNTEKYPSGFYFRTNPRYADVYIDNIYVGKSDTGILIKKPVGTYNIRYEYPPFPSKSESWTIQSTVYGHLIYTSKVLAIPTTITIKETNSLLPPIEGVLIESTQTLSNGYVNTQQLFSNNTGQGTFLLEPNIPATIKLSKSYYNTYIFTKTVSGWEEKQSVILTSDIPKIQSPTGFTSILTSIWSFLKTIFPGLN